MNDRKPGENFTEEAKSFVDEIKAMAAHNYQKLLTLGNDLGQKLQKTFNPTFGIGGTGSGSKKRPVQDDTDQKKSDDS